MSRYSVVAAVAMFVLGAVVGHSVTVPATVAGHSQASSALELMMNAPRLADTTPADAV